MVEFVAHLVLDAQVLPATSCAVFNSQSVSPHQLLVLDELTSAEVCGVYVVVPRVVVHFPLLQKMFFLQKLS